MLIIKHVITNLGDKIPSVSNLKEPCTVQFLRARSGQNYTSHDFTCLFLIVFQDKKYQFFIPTSWSSFSCMQFLSLIFSILHLTGHTRTVHPPKMWMTEVSKHQNDSSEQASTIFFSLQGRTASWEFRFSTRSGSLSRGKNEQTTCTRRLCRNGQYVCG